MLGFIPNFIIIIILIIIETPMRNENLSLVRMNIKKLIVTE